MCNQVIADPSERKDLYGDSKYDSVVAELNDELFDRFSAQQRLMVSLHEDKSGTRGECSIARRRLYPMISGSSRPHRCSRSISKVHLTVLMHSKPPFFGATESRLACIKSSRPRNKDIYLSHIIFIFPLIMRYSFCSTCANIKFAYSCYL